MRSLRMIPVAGGLAALAACGGGADDRAAERIKERADNRADALEEAAENAPTERTEERLEDRAEQVRATGEEKAEAADDQDDATLAEEADTP